VSLKDTSGCQQSSMVGYLPMCLYWKQLDKDCCLVQSPDTSPPREKSVTAASTEWVKEPTH